MNGVSHQLGNGNCESWKLVACFSNFQKKMCTFPNYKAHLIFFFTFCVVRLSRSSLPGLHCPILPLLGSPCPAVSLGIFVRRLGRELRSRASFGSTCSPSLSFCLDVPASLAIPFPTVRMLQPLGARRCAQILDWLDES